MSISTLTQTQRGMIYALLNQGNSQQKIADIVGVAKSTISYELQRVQPYDPDLAHLDALQKRKRCGRKSVLTPKLKQFIEYHLRLTWSPEQVANLVHVAVSSIYNWIDSGSVNFPVSDLPDRAKRRKRAQETRGKFSCGTSIEQRSDTINERQEFGHWEVDTVVSSRGKSKHCLVTFVERKSRFLWAIKASNRSATELNRTFDKFMTTFKSSVKSITVDHGKEFSGYRELEQKYGITVYFCHPYSPWERGSNEYFNRKLRWFFPKKTNFDLVSDDEIVEALELINNRPLKLHNYKTAIDLFKFCSD